MPGPLYCDTSALLKLYLPEPGSDELNEIVEGRDDVLVSDLAVTEIVSAAARRLRPGARSRGRLCDACSTRSSGVSTTVSTLAFFDARLAAAARAGGLAVYP